MKDKIKLTNGLELSFGVKCYYHRGTREACLQLVDTDTHKILSQTTNVKYWFDPIAWAKLVLEDLAAANRVTQEGAKANLDGAINAYHDAKSRLDAEAAQLAEWSKEVREAIDPPAPAEDATPDAEVKKSA